MANWKTRTGSGIRFYFKVVNNAGNLRTGLGSGVFTCLVINPGDTANQSITISESTQQAGVYYGDIPSAFLLANGVGHYSISIGVHATGPTLNAETSRSLEVNVDDIDYIATQILDQANGIETDWTLRQAQRILLAAAAGVTSGFENNTPTFKSVTGAKNRITGQQDQGGNRTNVSFDKS